mgnify:CR=1 FL=1
MPPKAGPRAAVSAASLRIPQHFHSALAKRAYRALRNTHQHGIAADDCHTAPQGAPRAVPAGVGGRELGGKRGLTDARHAGLHDNRNPYTTPSAAAPLGASTSTEDRRDDRLLTFSFVSLT